MHGVAQCLGSAPWRSLRGIAVAAQLRAESPARYDRRRQLLLERLQQLWTELQVLAHHARCGM
eukprot:4290166-Lingulodinium_polyedra.AAC.1